MTNTPNTPGPSRAQLLTLLADQVREYAFLFLDPKARIIEWSVGAQKLFGYSRDEALGLDFAKIFSPEDQERGIVQLELAIAAGDAISEDDRWHVRKDGSRLWCTGSLTALRTESRELIGFAKILRDRTNLKEQLDLLLRQAEISQGHERNQALVIAKVSHELRNLLAALNHGLQLIGSPRSDSARRDMLTHVMTEQIDLVRRLTEDLLDAERMKAGKVSLKLEPLALQDVLNRALDIVRTRVEAKGLELKCFEPGAPVRVHGDAMRLYQVFGNLLENAIKYTPAGGRIWVKITIEDPQAVVHVEDDGVGIPSHMLERIFELFTQVDADEVHKGLGIGLSLVRDLVLLHGGSVQARSEGPGKGSIFSVRLPLAGAS